MAGISRVGSAFSTLPFDAIDNIRTVFFHDDFLGADDSNGYLNTLNGTWLSTTTATTAIDGVAGHPGIVRVEASYLSPGETLAANDLLIDSNGLYLAIIARLPDVSADGPVAFGINDALTDVLGDVNDTFVGLVVTSAGAFELEYLAVGEVDYDITVPDNDWFMLELHIDTAGAYGRVTTEDGSETRYIESGGTSPAASVAVLDATGTVDVDAWHQRYERPDIAANKGVSWLGQSGA
jgi:hypothetical protein